MKLLVMKMTTRLKKMTYNVSMVIAQVSTKAAVGRVTRYAGQHQRYEVIEACY